MKRSAASATRPACALKVLRLRASRGARQSITRKATHRTGAATSIENFVTHAAPPEGERLEDVVVAVPEAIRVFKLHQRRVIRQRDGGRRFLRLDEEQREGRDEFYERRVFVDESAVARNEVVVGRGNHDDLVR